MTSDPWRYRCIKCGSTQLIFHPTAGKGDTPMAGGREATHRYKCDQCGAKRNQRKDMKTGKVVA